MTSRKKSKNSGIIVVTSALDVADAAAARDALLETAAAATPMTPATVEFDAPAPTAPALQLAAATRLSLLARDAFAGFGPRAAAALGAPEPAKGDAG